MEHNVLSPNPRPQPKLPEFASKDFKNHWVETMSNEDYQGKSDFISASGLVEMMKSPYHFHEYCRGNAPDMTPSQTLGTLIHAALLEPKRFRRFMALKPDFNRRTNEGKRDHEAWMKLHENHIVVDQHQFEVLTSVLESVEKNPELVGYLSQGHKEISGFFRDPHTGLKCRLRPDLLIPADTVESMPAIIIDVKSTRCAEERKFFYSVEEYHYDMKAAFYLHGASIISGQPIEFFKWVAVENVPPYVVSVFDVDQATLETGKWKFRTKMKQLKECLETNDWPAYQREPQTLMAPEWYLRKYEHIYADELWQMEAE